MNGIVFHIASGQAFFTGVALMLVAIVASSWRSPWASRVKVWALLVGAIAVAISSTPLPYWFYALAIFVTAAWLVASYFPRWSLGMRIAALAVWIVAAAMEIPYLLTPTLSPATSRTMTVIGDSVTAGMGPGEKFDRWPALISQAHQVHVQDLAYPGETAASALSRARRNKIQSSVVLLEIGGNDLLGGTSPAKFARDLDALLTHVNQPGRQLVMFELPLPPFKHEFGRIQRQLALKHGVALLPKRIFLSILAPSDSTLDTIHLTKLGHERMAASVWQIVAAAFPADLAGHEGKRPTPPGESSPAP